MICAFAMFREACAHSLLLLNNNFLLSLLLLFLCLALYTHHCDHFRTIKCWACYFSSSFKIQMVHEIAFVWCVYWGLVPNLWDNILLLFNYHVATTLQA